MPGGESPDECKKEGEGTTEYFLTLKSRETRHKVRRRKYILASNKGVLTSTRRETSLV